MRAGCTKLTPRMGLQHSVPEVQLAAGGLVWRKIAGVRKLAVIHRPKYDDWTLPKGKPEAGEAPGETARREIEEEIACKVRFLEFAGVIHYPIGDERTKVVLFWHVTPIGEQPFHPNLEVDELLWLTREEALEKLTNELDRELLLTAGAPTVI